MACNLTRKRNRIVLIYYNEKISYWHQIHKTTKESNSCHGSVIKLLKGMNCTSLVIIFSLGLMWSKFSFVPLLFTIFTLGVMRI